MMRRFPFTKVQALGNNFVLLNGFLLPEMDWPEVARQMSDHHFGVGSDGLLVLLPSEKADFLMRMFNPDGSEDVCGNGLRCAVIYTRLSGLSNKDRMVFEMIDGLHDVEVTELRETGGVARVNMGKPSFSVRDMSVELGIDEMIDYPLKVGGETLRLTCVKVGTPHAIIFAPEEAFWDQMPPVSGIIETHPAFPDRISVTWCHVESPDALRVRTWERAVGPTLACGTGACCSLAAAHRLGMAGRWASVTSPGGVLKVDWPEEDDIYLSGPAEIVFEGQWLCER